MQGLTGTSGTGPLWTRGAHQLRNSPLVSSFLSVTLSLLSLLLCPVARASFCAPVRLPRYADSAFAFISLYDESKADSKQFQEICCDLLFQLKTWAKVSFFKQQKCKSAFHRAEPPAAWEKEGRENFSQFYLSSHTSHIV